MQSVSEILEWPKLLAHLESCCQTGYGRVRINEEDLFRNSAESIQREMQRVEETKILIQRYGDISMSEPPDVMGTLQRLAKQGDVHSPQALSELLIALRALRQLMRFFLQNRSREETPTLFSALDLVAIPNPLIEQLEALVSDKGELLNSASPEYARLKGRIQEVQAAIRQQLQSMIARPGTAKFLQEAIVTEREGRAVLPVKAEHKVDIPGIVHGTSATGSTLYIEPRGVVEQNNRLISLKSELEQEIRRILHQISQALHPEVDVLRKFIEDSAELDVLMAKARQSLIFKAHPVFVKEEAGQLELKQARHPLLLLQLPEVVPNDVFLSPPHRVMLITGPNTGGKTVILKLIGLFALMVRAGLHLPVSEGSSMSLFDPVLADIGDPQSIEQNLSTFSGHITRLKSFLQVEDLSRGLILVDEICAGTDPQEGSVLAQALLDTFYSRGSTAVVTTHIGELKVFAHQQPGYVNASVEFNPETLSPTYRLLLGVPGTSNALNIAARLGMPQEVIDSARGRMAQPVSESASLIESLETKNRQLTEELEKAKKLREEIQWEEEQVRTQLNRIEGEKRKTLQMFKEGLKDKLRGIEQEVDDLRREVRQPKRPNPQSVQHISGRFRKAERQTGEFFAEETEKLYPQPNIAWERLQVGDIVESRSLNLSGTIIEKHDAKQEVTLQAGILKTVVPFSDIVQKVGKQQPNKKQNQRSSNSGKVQLQPRSIELECDVRGLNSEDAIAMLEKFLDDAMVTGVATVGIIHGLGTGVLKKAIRQHLKELPYIKSYGPAAAIDGGDGKTIINL